MRAIPTISLFTLVGLAAPASAQFNHKWASFENDPSMISVGGALADDNHEVDVDWGDLDGDGFKEIVLQDDDRVIAMKAVPEPLWKTESIDELESLVVTESGNVVAQADGVLTTYGPDGRVLGHGEAGEADPQAGARRLGHLAIDEGHLRLGQGGHVHLGHVEVAGLLPVLIEGLAKVDDLGHRSVIV